MVSEDVVVRRAQTPDALTVAGLLDRFNREFDSPTPGVDVLAARLARLFERDDVWALVAWSPGTAGSAAGPGVADAVACGFALVTCRPSVWYDGPIALLDELYVVPALRDRGIGTTLIGALLDESARIGVSAIEIEVDEPDSDAQRFYRRHGFADRDPDTGDRALVFRRDLAP